MRPSAYDPLTTIPITASGKTDRKRLRELGAQISRDDLFAYSPNSSEDYTKMTDKASPKTSEEGVMKDLWSRLFEMDRDPLVNDNFFRLGGDSMMAMRLVSLARREKVRLTVDKVFRHPRLGDLARQIKIQDDKATGSRFDHEVCDVELFSLLQGLDVEELRFQAACQCRVALDQIDDIYLVTALQERFMTRAFLGSITETSIEKCRQKRGPRDEQAQLSFQVPANVDVQAFETAWRTVYRRHDALRARIIDTPIGLFQVVVNEDLAWNQWNGLHQDRIQRDRRNAMVFGDRLFRVALIVELSTNDEQSRQFFVLGSSHAIYDGFSFEMLWQQVEAEYHLHSGRNGIAPSQNPSYSSPKMFPPLQMKHLIQQRLRMDRNLAISFWRMELLDADNKPIAPYDRLDRRIPNKTRRSATVEMDQTHLAGSDITLSTMITVAAALTLSHALDCPDIIFEALLSGRNGPLPGVEELMGPAITCMPARIRLSNPKDRMVHDVLRDTQSLLHKDLVVHEHVGWWDLVHTEEFKQVLRSVPQLNVNRNPYLEFGKTLGLVGMESSSHNEVFYAMSSFMREGKLILVISSDDRIVQSRQVRQHLTFWSEVLAGLTQIGHGGETIIVSEFVASCGYSFRSLTRPEVANDCQQ